MTNRRIVPAALLAHDDHDHDPNSELDRGLTYDVNTLLRRRGALGLLGGAALTALAGCATASTSGGGASATGFELHLGHRLGSGIRYGGRQLRGIRLRRRLGGAR